VEGGWWEIVSKLWEGGLPVEVGHEGRGDESQQVRAAAATHLRSVRRSATIWRVLGDTVCQMGASCRRTISSNERNKPWG